MMKELEIRYPPITAYMTHAPVLSIISDSEDYLPWFLFNYIQVCIHDCNSVDFYTFFVNKYICPHLEVIDLSRSFIENNIKGDIIEFFIGCIDQDYYILANIETFYVSLYSKGYDKRYLEHPILIYGYNKRDEEFSVGDFFNGGEYVFTKATFAEVRKAYDNNHNEKSWIRGVKLFKKVNHKHEFRMQDFKNLLERYLYGFEPSHRYHYYGNKLIGFGMEKLYSRIHENLDSFTKFEEYDFRALPIFCDHKKVLYMAIKYLLEIGQFQLEYLLARYKELYDQSIILRNRQIKYMVKGQNNMFDYKELDRLKSKEIYLLENTINLLKGRYD